MIALPFEAVRSNSQKSKISTNIVHFGILSNNYFSYEARERFYNKFLPNPPKKGDLNYIFGTIFNKKDDFKWVCSIENSIWVEFFKALFNNSKNITKTKNHCQLALFPL